MAPTNNPFFQTTQGDIGYNLSKSDEPQSGSTWKSPLSEADYALARTQGNIAELDATAEDLKKAAYEKGNFSFLYARTSDAIGAKAARKSDDVNGGADGKILRMQPKSKAEFLRDCYKSTSALAAKEQNVLANGKCGDIFSTVASYCSFHLFILILQQLSQVKFKNWMLLEHFVNQNLMWRIY
mgnify:CR=1 FL=1